MLSIHQLLAPPEWFLDALYADRWQHSRSGRSVDAQKILHQTREIADLYREELESTLQWAQSTPFSLQARVPLPNGLSVPGAADQ